MNCFKAEAFSAIMSLMLFWPAIVCAVAVAAMAFAIWRRHQDKMLADMAEKAPVGLLQVGANGVIQWANLAEQRDGQRQAELHAAHRAQRHQGAGTG